MKAYRIWTTILLVLLALLIGFLFGSNYFNKTEKEAAATECPVCEKLVCPACPVCTDKGAATVDPCIKVFTDKGASEAIAKDICADTGSGNATRMVSGEKCEGWATLVYDADRDVEIVKNLVGPSKAFYGYCYPKASDIQNAPFFVGAEKNPFGEAFGILFVEPK